MDRIRLVLGPLLRYVDESCATVWVETSGPGDVAVLGATAPTFEVHGHHYALVTVTGLEPGASIEYDVRLNGRVGWPEPGARYPGSRIRTLPHRDGRLRLVFGSCRKPHTYDSLGTDALVAYAERLRGLPEAEWPQGLLLLGDQVYADETTGETQRWLAGRRDLRQPPGTAVADFDEYAHLYHEAWSDPPVRWLLSTVPVAMIFDDHDVHDDWNTSQAWRTRMRRLPWWAERLRGAFVSYWVYQHLGNLAPADLADDPTAAAVLGQQGDRADTLRRMAEIADNELDGAKNMQWSYRRQFGRTRLLMIDSRAGRILDGDARSMLDENEFRWVEDNAQGDHDHLLIGSSLPWLMPPAFSHLESLNEAACLRPGRRGRLAEWIRQRADFEHWAAFRTSFDRLTRLIIRTGQGNRAPASISVLSGDVHHAYIARARFPQRTASAVHQLTCSPVHNTAPWYVRLVFRAAWWRVTTGLTRRWLRRAGPSPLPVTWSGTIGPHFANAVMTIDLSGRHAETVLEESTPAGLAERARVSLT